MSSSDVTLLLVDDDSIDRRAVRRGLQKRQIENEVVEAEDGLEALEILRGDHPSKSVNQPCIVLLDLKMPRMNGHEFLVELRADQKLRQQVVFVLSTSDDEEERHRAYERCISGYIVKTKAGQGLIDAVDLVQAYSKAVDLP